MSSEWARDKYAEILAARRGKNRIPLPKLVAEALDAARAVGKAEADAEKWVTDKFPSQDQEVLITGKNPTGGIFVNIAVRKLMGHTFDVEGWSWTDGETYEPLEESGFKILAWVEFPSPYGSPPITKLDTYAEGFRAGMEGALSIVEWAKTGEEECELRDAIAQLPTAPAKGIEK